MGNIITVQVGQCGNQIGAEFWDRISWEHGISASGEVKERKGDRKDIFFYESSDGRYFPRSVLVDLEPRVISSISQSRPGIFNRESIWVSSEGGGAGNLWSSGYQQGKNNSESIMEILQRETENSDNTDGFILFHSVGGGTGSGLGSFLLERIRETWPKKTIQTVSVFPNNEEVSDAVVQPYNTILTMKRLRECADGVIAMDNGGLARVSGDPLQGISSNFAHTNRLASSVCAASTQTLRFPGSRFSDLSSILYAASPVKGCHFLVPSYAPFLEGNAPIRKTTCLDVQRKLLLPKSRLVSFEESESNLCLSAINIMMGVDAKELEKSSMRMKQKNSLRFAPWAPSCVQVALGGYKEESVSGVLLSNTTGFSRALERISSQYDRLKARNAFLEMYKREGAHYVEEFEPARESVQWIIDEYRRAQRSDYCWV
ncbi:tubulin gamma [Nematocida sp. LUAm3]|nr:tubulin gamma [Nematocida sp. LUAm3]KAI5174665.1 tubulin gamma [Nematocida sp. LUAm2]KAI5177925.1 tubulin gamma [Nematocida sp. LUAm1]